MDTPIGVSRQGVLAQATSLCDNVLGSMRVTRQTSFRAFMEDFLSRLPSRMIDAPPVCVGDFADAILHVMMSRYRSITGSIPELNISRQVYADNMRSQLVQTIPAYRAIPAYSMPADLETARTLFFFNSDIRLLENMPTDVWYNAQTRANTTAPTRIMVTQGLGAFTTDNDLIVTRMNDERRLLNRLVPQRFRGKSLSAEDLYRQFLIVAERARTAFREIQRITDRVPGHEPNAHIQEEAYELAIQNGAFPEDSLNAFENGFREAVDAARRLHFNTHQALGTAMGNLMRTGILREFERATSNYEQAALRRRINEAEMRANQAEADREAIELRLAVIISQLERQLGQNQAALAVLRRDVFIFAHCMDMAATFLTRSRPDDAANTRAALNIFFARVITIQGDDQLDANAAVGAINDFVNNLPEGTSFADFLTEPRDPTQRARTLADAPEQAAQLAASRRRLDDLGAQLENLQRDSAAQIENLRAAHVLLIQRNADKTLENDALMQRNTIVTQENADLARANAGFAREAILRNEAHNNEIATFRHEIDRNDMLQRRRLDALRNEIAQQAGQLRETRDQLTEQNNRLEQSDKLAAERARRLERTDADLQWQTRQHNEAMRALHRRTLQLADTERVLERTAAQLQVAQGEIEERGRAFLEMQTALDDAQNDKNTMQTELEAVRARANRLTRQRNDLQAELTAAEEEKKATAGDTQERVKALSEVFTHRRTRLVEEKQRELAALQARVDAADARVAELTAQLAAAEARADATQPANRVRSSSAEPAVSKLSSKRSKTVVPLRSDSIATGTRSGRNSALAAAGSAGDMHVPVQIGNPRRILDDIVTEIGTMFATLNELVPDLQQPTAVTEIVPALAAFRNAFSDALMQERVSLAAMATETARLTQQMETLQLANARLTEERNATTLELRKLHAQQESSAEDNGRLIQKVALLGKETDDKQKQLMDSNWKIAELQETNDSLKKTLRTATEDLTRVREGLAKNRKTIEEQTEEIAQREQEQARLREENSALQHRIRSQEATVAKLQEDVAKLGEENEIDREELGKTARYSMAKTDEIKQKVAELEESANQLKQAKSELATAESKLQELQERLSTNQAQQADPQDNYAAAETLLKRIQAELGDNPDHSKLQRLQPIIQRIGETLAANLPGAATESAMTTPAARPPQSLLSGNLPATPRTPLVRIAQTGGLTPGRFSASSSMKGSRRVGEGSQMILGGIGFHPDGQPMTPDKLWNSVGNFTPILKFVALAEIMTASTATLVKRQEYLLFTMVQVQKQHTALVNEEVSPDEDEALHTESIAYAADVHKMLQIEEVIVQAVLSMIHEKIPYPVGRSGMLGWRAALEKRLESNQTVREWEQLRDRIILWAYASEKKDATEALVTAINNCTLDSVRIGAHSLDTMVGASRRFIQSAKDVVQWMLTSDDYSIRMDVFQLYNDRVQRLLSGGYKSGTERDGILRKFRRWVRLELALPNVIENRARNGIFVPLGAFLAARQNAFNEFAQANDILALNESVDLRDIITNNTFTNLTTRGSSILQQLLDDTPRGPIPNAGDGKSGNDDTDDDDDDESPSAGGTASGGTASAASAGALGTTAAAASAASGGRATRSGTDPDSTFHQKIKTAFARDASPLIPELTPLATFLLKNPDTVKTTFERYATKRQTELENAVADTRSLLAEATQLKRVDIYQAVFDKRLEWLNAELEFIQMARDSIADVNALKQDAAQNARNKTLKEATDNKRLIFKTYKKHLKSIDQVPRS